MAAQAGNAYVAFCAILTALAIFDVGPSYLAYYAVLIAALPVSLLAAMVTYVGGTLLFGPDLDGPTARAVTFAVWVMLVTAQMVFIRSLVRASGRKRAARQPS